MKILTLLILLFSVKLLSAQQSDIGFNAIVFTSGFSIWSNNSSFEQSISKSENISIPQAAYSLDFAMPFYYLSKDLSMDVNMFFDYKKRKMQIRTLGIGASINYKAFEYQNYNFAISIGGAYLFNSFTINNPKEINNSMIDSTILRRNESILFKQGPLACTTLGIFNEFEVNEKWTIIGTIKYRWDYGKSDQYIIKNKSILLSDYYLNKIYFGLGLKIMIYNY